jgi:hypothetical protein
MKLYPVDPDDKLFLTLEVEQDLPTLHGLTLRLRKGSENCVLGRVQKVEVFGSKDGEGYFRIQVKTSTDSTLPRVREACKEAHIMWLEVQQEFPAVEIEFV